MSTSGAPEATSTFEGWEPHTVIESDVVTSGTTLALHGLLDADGAAPSEGDPLPMLWHWLAFLPRVPQRELGEDGHPRLGTFLPPVKLPRRMFAGARLWLQRPLTVGAPLTRRGKVTSVTNKQGRSGQLCFVTVRYEITDGRGGALEEEQDIVYRDASKEVAATRLTTPDAAGQRASVPSEPNVAFPDSKGAWALQVEISSTLLFRFSALTYNAHRIHYDRDFARDIEGYPGLVVHGPLQAVLLTELCRRNAPDNTLHRFSFQAKSPAFDGGSMMFVGHPDNSGEIALEARDGHGTTTMLAHAVLRGASQGR